MIIAIENDVLDIIDEDTSITKIAYKKPGKGFIEIEMISLLGP